MIEEPPVHDVKLRGAGLQLAQLIDGAIERGERPPDQWVAKGRAGTGKSFGVGGALIRTACMYPEVPGRVLILRLTRKSITTSTCVTIRKILPPGDPMVDDGRSDENRTHYRRGAWTFALDGLNNIANQLSTEWDFIWVDECRQIALAQWEELAFRGMRNYALYLHDAQGRKCAEGQGVSPIPFGMCIGTTNPWMPKTWFNLAASRGRLTLVNTTLPENPAYFDDDGNISEMGAEYERKAHATMPPSSPRFKRLVLGIDWGAEGMIYEEWVGELEPADPKDAPNLVRMKRGKDGWIERETLIARGITEFYAGVDFGDDDAGVLVVAGLTKTRELVVVAEVYARRKTLDWWSAQVRQVHAHYPITLGFCDHRPELVRAFNDYVGAPYGEDDKEVPGQIFIRADKSAGSVDRGIQIVRVRIARKTLLFDVDALMHPPQAELVDAGLPACTVDEIPGYVFKRKEEDDEKVSTEKSNDQPDPKCHDHGCDATRYLCVGVDYFEPEQALAEPRNDAYKKRLLLLKRPLGRRFEAVEEVEDLETYAEDEDVDTMRSAWK